MKALIRSVVLAALLYLCPSLAQAQEAPKPEAPFTQTLSKSTLAVYRGKQICKYTLEDMGFFFGSEYVWGCEFKTKFTCTATVIGQLDEHVYVGLTAGHCFDRAVKDEYYVADDVQDKPVVHRIQLVKFEVDDRYDFAVFQFHSLQDYVPIDLNGRDEDTPIIGTEIVNINISKGVGKEHLEGKVVSAAMTVDGMKSRYMVSVGVGPGASGSAVVDAKTHKIVGLVEAIFPGTQMATVVMPTGRHLIDFMDDDSAGLIEPAPTGPPPEMPAPKEPTVADLLSQLWSKWEAYVESHWWLQ